MESTNNTSKLCKLKALEALVRHETCIKQNEERQITFTATEEMEQFLKQKILVFSTYSVPGIFTYLPAQ